MLHEPDRHEALQGQAWDPARAREGVRLIAHRLLADRDAHGHWRAHPQDLDGAADPAGGYQSLYLGAAGVLWALWRLQRGGHVPDTGLDFDDALARADADYHARATDTNGTPMPGYHLGQAGVLLLRWRVHPDADVAQRLFDVVQANIGNPTNEALWAAPGTIVAAWHLWRATAEPRWQRLFVDNLEQVWTTWRHDEASDTWLWTQDLYGRVVQYLGAGHGFVGNVYALLLGWAELGADRQAELVRRCERTLTHFAQREDDAVNWPAGTYTPRPGAPRWLVQWCHGAPGFVTALSALPTGRSPVIDDLLRGAGLTTWRAGPLTKGAGLCHGTAGNAYALLKLYRRTGQVAWLQRARAMAMHALHQHEQAFQRHGRPRPTLWTGDAGVALLLVSCLEGDADWPSLDAV